MTLQEVLTSKGLDAKQVEEILTDMKANKIYTASEENLDVRYGKLKEEHEALITKDSESQKLIESLQKVTKGQEDVQNKIVDYRNRVATLESELEQTKIDSAIKVGLLSEKAVDIEYLTFKLKESLAKKGEKLELDESGNIKGWQERVSDLKTQLPNQFTAGMKDGFEGFKPINEDSLQNKGLTKNELLHKPYPERMKFYNEHPEEYEEIMKG